MTKFRVFLLQCSVILTLLCPSVLTSGQVCADSNGNIYVTNTDDEGPGSLRAAIECANSTAGANTILFDISTPEPHIIQVGTLSGLPLPALDDPATVIDGRSQNGYTELAPVIILEGEENNWGNPINAIWIRADFCEIYALEIREFPDDGIEIQAADFCILEANYIHNNGLEQDFFPNVPGTGPWEGSGIVLTDGSTQNLIRGNEIANNEHTGILVEEGSNTNLVGGPVPEHRNEIRNNPAGMIVGSGVQNVQIQRNSFYCNDTIGIELQNNANNQIEAPEIIQLLDNQLSGTAPVGSVVELYISDNTACPGAVCQGGLLIGTTIAVDGTWIFAPSNQNGLPIFGGYIITATATDPQGNTSEFADCKVVIGTSGCTNQNGEIVVSNTNDSGSGSLRRAIECANSTLGANTIIFDIPGDTSHTIFVGSENNEALPALLDPATIIDATTQNGFGENGDFRPKVILDGSQADWTIPANGLWLRADYCEVYGLKLTKFPGEAIDVTLADYVQIGDSSQGNVIYSNGAGIVLQQGSDFGIIRGNAIGTDYAQMISIGNDLFGISIRNGGDQQLLSDNIIAHHPIGVQIDSGGIFNTLKRNILYCNDSIPLDFSGNANLNYPAPVIDSATNFLVAGLANAGDIIEIYKNADTACIGSPCQGGIYLGMVEVIDSTWTLTAPFVNNASIFSGDLITALATDSLGNTSLYSSCFSATVLCDLEVTTNMITATSCGMNDGSFSVNITGGTPPFQLDIGQGTSMDTNFQNLEAGEYTLIVTDVNACSVELVIEIGASIGLDVSIINQMDATCGIANGQFTVQIDSGNPPYLFDIGDGPTSNNLFDQLNAGMYSVTVIDNENCSQELSVEIDQLDGPEISIASISNETCHNANGVIIVDEIGGTAPFTYDIGNGPTNNPFFQNLGAGTYTITITDANGCIDFVSAQITNEGELPVSGYIYNNQDGQVNFTSTASEADEYFWDFGDGNTSSLENPVYTYTVSDIYEVCLTVTNECSMDEYCEFIEIIIPLVPIDIAGTIAKENGQTVALTEIFINDELTQITEVDGNFLLEDQAVGNDWTIEPFKNINYLNGCSTFDIFLINQHILEVTPLDSPYKIIAADINNSGSVTTLDLITLQQVILFNVDTFTNNTSWRFVPGDFVFTDPTNPFLDDFPESISLQNINADTLQNDFVGIKVGDVNLSSDPANFSEPEQDVIFSIKKIKEERGEVILEFKPQKSDLIAAYEFALVYDPEVLQLEGKSGEMDFQPELHQIGSTLFISWYDKKGMGVESKEYSFRLKFKTLSDNWQTSIRLSNHKNAKVFGTDGNVKGVSFGE